METSTEGTARPDSSAVTADTAVAGGPSAVPPASLSPSRASDFMQCPLLYR
ncbi:recombinase RecB, partial [Streptomyces pilosus]